MKRALVLLGSLCIITGVLRAADAVTIATQQEAEERMKRLTATIEEFQTSQAALQKQVNMLASDLSKLREDAARNNNNTETQESIRRLREQILKVDEARIADNKRIQEALEKMARSIKEIASTPPPPTGRTQRVPPSDPPPSSDNPGGGSRLPPNNGPQLGFDYIIKSGDALSIIVQKYRKENIMVTAQSIKEANPGVDWDRLQIGKKIFIPKPAK
jgi:LysM repeat protein